MRLNDALAGSRPSGRGLNTRSPISLCLKAALLLIGLLLLPIGGTQANEPSDGAYVLGVFPHLPPRELEKVYAPIAANLGRHLGREVKFRSSSTYERFMQRLDSQAFDIVFVQPFDYVRLADSYGYLPLATRSESLKTIFVVKPDSSIHRVADLAGRRVALPPEVAAVSRLARLYFRDQGLESPVQLSYHRSHVSCMQQVLIGAADACGTAAPARRFFEHKMGVTLREVGATAAIPHTLFAVNPRVPARDRQILLDTIVSWSDTPSGRAMLKRGRLSGFVAVSDEAYDVVRRLSRLH